MTTNALEFAPLAHDELNRRAEDERMACGYRCVTVVDINGGEFEPRDLDFLREHASLADAYHDAALARCAR